MKLLDAATVKTGTGDWTRGHDANSRICAGVSVYLAECDPAVTATVIGEDLDAADFDVPAAGCKYRVQPFGIMATLRRNTMLEQSDDAAWLAAALTFSAEMPVARGFLIQQGIGDTWIGSANTHQVTNSGSTVATLRTAVLASRAQWFNTVIGAEPLLHVSPAAALQLRDAGIIQLDPVSGDDRTLWGDPVVMSPGYADITGLSATPIFWSGPIEITLSAVNQEEVMREVRANRAMYQVSMLAEIDTDPCAIIRIGAAPA